MENDNSQPLLVAGTIPDKCYTDVNEFVTEIAKVLRIPTDTISVIKGAQGEPGKTGPKGDKGAQGDKGTPLSVYNKTYNIPNAAPFVEIDLFTGWQFASYNTSYNGTVTDYEGVSDVVVAVGTIVPVPPVIAADPPVKARVYFVTKDNAAINNDKFRLHVSYASNT